MRYQQVKSTGSWVKKSEIVSGTKCKLVSETTPSEGVYEGKTIKNNVAKIRFQGETGEAKNVNVNTPSINALIEAYGEDSTQWIGKLLTAQTEKSVIGGKRVTVLYLIPEGFELKEDDGGYLVISPIEKKAETPSKKEKIEYPDEVDTDINPEDIPF